MTDPFFDSTKEDLAQDLADFANAIKLTPDPLKTLTDLLQKTHATLAQPNVHAKYLLALWTPEARAEHFLSQRHALSILPFLTLYGGPVEQQLGDKLWGPGWGQKGRYAYKSEGEKGPTAKDIEELNDQYCT